MQVAFFLAGEITQVTESIPRVRCASGNVSSLNINCFLQKYFLLRTCRASCNPGKSQIWIDYFSLLLPAPVTGVPTLANLIRLRRYIAKIASLQCNALVQ